MDRYDILVVGGGSAGIVAALQAARAGAKTLLVEKNEILGGTLFNANIKIPGLFHAWGKQVIAGIGWELVEKTVNEETGIFPDFGHPGPRLRQHWLQQVEVNTALYAMIAEEELRKAGATILLDTMVGAIRDGDKKEVTLCAKEGLFTVSVTVIIDCTGDANAVRMAGFPVERSEEAQPGTYVCRLDGYDPRAVDMDAIAHAYDEEVAAGRLRYTDVSWNSDCFASDWLTQFGQNANHVDCRGVDPETSAGRTELAVLGRRSLLALYRFFRKQKGLEAIRFSYLAPEVGVRESVRIVGEERLALDSFISGAIFPDSVCYTFYPVDIHTLSGKGLTQIYPAEGVVPTVRRGALIPKGSRNFLAAGRCISSDQAVNSVVRVQASCMATGQVAGALAALAVTGNVTVSDVPNEDLRRLLTSGGAILP